MATHTPNGFSVPQMTRSIISSLGLITPRTYDAYVKNFPDMIRESYIMTAESLPGVLQWTPNKEFYHWEDFNKPLPSFQITADATGAAGAAVTVTLTAGSHQNTAAGSGAYSPVAVGQIWEDDATGLRYEVRAVNKATPGAHTASLAPVNSAQTTDFTAADSFFKFIGRVSVKEGSEQRDGIYRSFQKVTRDLSIIRNDKEYTDLSMFEQLDIPDVGSFYTIDKTDLEKDFVKSQELQLMFGVVMNNLQTDNNMNTNATGLIPQVQAAGSTYAPPTAGTIDDAYFEGLARLNDADGYTDEYHVLVDTEFDIKLDNYLANRYGTDGAIVYASFGGSKEVAISRNFSSYSVHGVTYHRKKYAYFNSARTHGAEPNTGYWRNTALFIPQGEMVFEGERFRKFGIKYMSTEEGGPIVRFVQDGAMLNPNASTEMVAKIALVTYKGMDAYNLTAYKLSRLQ